MPYDDSVVSVRVGATSSSFATDTNRRHFLSRHSLRIAVAISFWLTEWRPISHLLDGEICGVILPTPTPALDALKRVWARQPLCSTARELQAQSSRGETDLALSADADAIVTGTASTLP